MFRMMFRAAAQEGWDEMAMEKEGSIAGKEETGAGEETKEGFASVGSSVPASRGPTRGERVDHEICTLIR